jgi:hypothetical protein
LITRQAISPRLAIRILLNMFFLGFALWAGSSALVVQENCAEATGPVSTARRPGRP